MRWSHLLRSKKVAAKIVVHFERLSERVAAQTSSARLPRSRVSKSADHGASEDDRIPSFLSMSRVGVPEEFVEGSRSELPLNRSPLPSVPDLCIFVRRLHRRRLFLAKGAKIA